VGTGFNIAEESNSSSVLEFPGFLDLGGEIGDKGSTLGTIVGESEECADDTEPRSKEHLDDHPKGGLRELSLNGEGPSFGSRERASTRGFVEQKKKKKGGAGGTSKGNV